MTKHTPGPWHVEPLKRTTGWLIHGPQGESITDGPIWTERFSAESKANSRLISASPDLLNVCENGIKDVQQVLDNWANGDLAGAVNGLEAWQESARAAIAKARGA